MDAMFAAGPVDTNLTYTDSPEVMLARELMASTTAKYLGYQDGDLSITMQRH